MRFAARAAALSAALLMFLSPLAAAYEAPSESYDGYTEIVDAVQPASVAAAAQAELQFDAAAAILVERDTGKVLYERNATAPRAIASITKVMTLLLVMEAIDAGKISLNDTVTASEHAYSMGGSQIWLEPGETMTVDELLKAVCVASANDAAVALAEYVSGSEPEFVAEMNRRAAELGMTHTTFKNSNGLDEEGHLSCAYDVSLMSRELLKHELIRKYVTIWTDELRGGETQLTNTNKLLRSFNGITGLKTGTTDDAGVCVSASAERDGMELIAVVLGSSDSKSRFEAAKTLLSFGFANYELADTGITPELLTPVKVRLGLSDSCAITVDAPQRMVVPKGSADKLYYDMQCAERLDAPVEQGQQVGEITLYCADELLATYPIVTTQSTGRLTFGEGLRMLFEELTKL